MMKLEKGQDILKVRGSILADRKPMWKARGRGRKRKEDNKQDRKLGGKMRDLPSQWEHLWDSKDV